MKEIGKHPNGKFILLAGNVYGKYTKCYWLSIDDNTTEEIQLNIIDPVQFLKGIWETCKTTS